MWWLLILSIILLFALQTTVVHIINTVRFLFQETSRPLYEESWLIPSILWAAFFFTWNV